MNATDKINMYRDIEKHGQDLKQIFPAASESEPVKLCKRLRRIEQRAHSDAEDVCNGVEMSEDWRDKYADKANALLGTDRVWVNGDPRGHALKVDLEAGEELHQDLGGYGIIAPDLSR